MSLIVLPIRIPFRYSLARMANTPICSCEGVKLISPVTGSKMKGVEEAKGACDVNGGKKVT